jgi:hypothetical protein
MDASFDKETETGTAKPAAKPKPATETTVADKPKPAADMEDEDLDAVERELEAIEDRAMAALNFRDYFEDGVA